MQPPTAREVRLESLLSERETQLSQLHASLPLLRQAYTNTISRMKSPGYVASSHRSLHRPPPALYPFPQQFHRSFFLKYRQPVQAQLPPVPAQSLPP